MGLYGWKRALLDPCEETRRSRSPSSRASWRQDASATTSVDGAVEDLRYLLDFVEEVGEIRGEDRLDAVREGFVGLVMNFD